MRRSSQQSFRIEKVKDFRDHTLSPQNQGLNFRESFPLKKSISYLSKYKGRPNTTHLSRRFSQNKNRTCNFQEILNLNTNSFLFKIQANKTKKQFNNNKTKATILSPKKNSKWLQDEKSYYLKPKWVKKQFNGKGFIIQQKILSSKPKFSTNNTKIIENVSKQKMETKQKMERTCRPAKLRNYNLQNKQQKIDRCRSPCLPWQVDQLTPVQIKVTRF